METEEKAPECLEQNPPDAGVGLEERSSIIPSTSDNAVPPQPAEKRPTRQWAAWTREEEESFFTALRQVGKNFEKITCRVQSKNKDQVRHYYYRLVRRMNKMLGPGLCLDAKNSKDTNTAMLRWWSLLEKYSCKASKLHLKPRRFKIFVEALEHQLIKDRKKNVKKRLSQGDSSSSSASTFPNQNKSSGNDVRAINIVVIDSQNVPKAGNGKGSSTRRNSNMGVSRSSIKGGSSPKKSTRKRRRTGAVSAAAMKRWEKAAMAGVSLVADAAEHVERSAGSQEADQLRGLNVLSIEAVGCSMEQNDPGSAQCPTNTSCAKSIAIESNLQNSVKLKLQLFPIDDGTRKALETDKHNPHLELTLSTRKKISSVLEHLSRKWGSSRVACGDLMLFPFDIQKENLLACHSWTRDSVVSAAEVYAMIGSPPVFRLRYGWTQSSEFHPSTSETNIAVSNDSHVHESERNQGPIEQAIRPVQEMDKLERHVNQSLSDKQTSETHIESLKQSVDVACGKRSMNPNVGFDDNLWKSAHSLASISLKRDELCGGSASRIMENVVDHRARKTPILSAGEWADSLTNVSVGDLLTEMPGDDMDANCTGNPLFKSSRCLEEIPFTCDSFDAAIAAHIFSQKKLGFSGPLPHSSSIWDAEETCDEFSFQKRALTKKQVPDSAMAAASVACEGVASTSSAVLVNNVELLQEVAMAEDTVEDPMDQCPVELHEMQNPAKDFGSLTDIYWPDSLGPLELDVPSCKYYSEDLILSDSLSGLNRLIASSLDAFQNCPFFGLEDKGPSPSAGVQGGASFAGKICTSDNAGVRSLQV